MPRGSEAFDLSQYTAAGGDVPPATDPLALGEEMETPDVDPEVEDALVVAFPELAGNSERISALAEAVRLLSGGL